MERMEFGIFMPLMTVAHDLVHDIRSNYLHKLSNRGNNLPILIPLKQKIIQLLNIYLSSSSLQKTGAFFFGY